MAKNRGGRPVIIGGAVMDFRGKPLNELLLYTSNPGLLLETPGGVGRNIAENLLRLGENPLLISAVGCDLVGDTLLMHMESIGLDTAGIVRIPDRRTAIYLAILAENGDLHTAIADMAIFAEITPEQVLAHQTTISKAPLVIVDTNLSRETLQAVAELCSEVAVPLLVEPVSVEKSKKLRGFYELITYISPNSDELRALAEVQDDAQLDVDESVQRLLNMGIKNVIVTQGADGVLFATHRNMAACEYMSTPAEMTADEHMSTCGKTQHFPALPATVLDVTGAGDAFVGGMAYGLLQDMDVENSIRCGLLTAKYTVETTETVSSLLNDQLFQSMNGYLKTLKWRCRYGKVYFDSSRG